MNFIFILFTGIIIVMSIFWYYGKYEEVLCPFILIAVICFLVQFIGPMKWVIDGTKDYWGIPIMKYMAQNELIFTVGYMFFWITFALYNPKPKKTVGKAIFRSWHDKTIDCDRRTAYVMYWALFAIYTAYLQTRGRSLMSQLSLGQMGVFREDTLTNSDLKLWFLLVALDMMIPVTCIILEIGRSRVRYLYYILTFVLVVSSGKRHLMLDITIAPIIVHFAMRNRKPKMSVIAIGSAVCYLLVSWIGAMREVYRTGTGELTAYDSQSAESAVMVNLEVFKSLSIFIPHFQSLSDFALGTTYICAFIQLIPTIFFPWKGLVIAILSRGTIRDAYGSALMSSGVAGTYWSLLYANGWIIGVVIGMALLGLWAKRMNSFRETDRLSYITEFAVITPFMFQLLTRAFGSALQTWFALVLPLFIIRRIHLGRD